MNILLLEDDTTLSTSAVEQLESHGYHVFPARGVDEARQILKDNPNKIDILIADHEVLDGSGAHFAIEVKGSPEKIKVVVISGQLSLENVDELEAHGIPYFNKPLLYASVVKQLIDDTPSLSNG